MGNTLNYVLITPARNEAAFIEQTIESVIAQTPRPVKWVIVSDGSTDGTDEIVTRYAANTPWLELIRAARQMSLPPIFIGGLALGAGYLWASIRQVPRPVSPELIAFHRREQMQRLSRFIRRNRSVVIEDVKPSSYCA
jgi:glycosyltransferase involved in cell wall biosynthesis